MNQLTPGTHVGESLGRIEAEGITATLIDCTWQNMQALESNLRIIGCHGRNVGGGFGDPEKSNWLKADKCRLRMSWCDVWNDADATIEPIEDVVSVYACPRPRLERLFIRSHSRLHTVAATGICLDAGTTGALVDACWVWDTRNVGIQCLDPRATIRNCFCQQTERAALDPDLGDVAFSWMARPTKGIPYHSNAAFWQTCRGGRNEFWPEWLEPGVTPIREPIDPDSRRPVWQAGQRAVIEKAKRMEKR